MGAIQNAINQSLGNVAKVATVAGVGKAIGEEKAAEAADETAKELVDQAYESMVDDTVKFNDSPIGKVLQKYGDIQWPRILDAQEAGETEMPEQEAFLTTALLSEKEKKMRKKALLSAYYKQENTSAIRLGYKTILDRIVGKGEK